MQSISDSEVGYHSNMKETNHGYMLWMLVCFKNSVVHVIWMLLLLMVMMYLVSMGVVVAIVIVIEVTPQHE